MIWFEKSGHFPLIEEPEKFNQVMKRIKQIGENNYESPSEASIFYFSKKEFTLKIKLIVVKFM